MSDFRRVFSVVLKKRGYFFEAFDASGKIICFKCPGNVFKLILSVRFQTENTYCQNKLVFSFKKKTGVKKLLNYKNN